MTNNFSSKISEIISHIKNNRLEENSDLILLSAKEDSRNLNYLFEIGVDCAENGRVNDALIIFERLKSCNVNDARIPYNLGFLYTLKQDYQSALKNFHDAYKIYPNDLDILVNYASTLHELKQYDSARLIFDMALALDPNCAQALTNKGVTLFELKQFDEVLFLHDKALTLEPQNYVAWSNKGNALSQLKRFDEAIACFDKALTLRPDYHEAWAYRGATMFELKRLNEAIANFDRALNVKPDYNEAAWNKSLSLLLQGDYQNGLPLYENRWRSRGVSEIAVKRSFDRPTWLGQESVKGKTIFIYGEQGLGDFIQFCRYTKLVANLGAKVILEVPQSLVTLLTGLTGVSQFVIKGQELPPFDFCCPIVSLPLACNTSVTSIPAENRYIVSDIKKASEWRLKLGEKKKKRVGLVWSSLSNFQHDAKRSLLLSDFVKALPVDGYEYVCLQKELKDCDREFFKQYQSIKFFGDQLNDFSDTAALIESVDLVVSTCTSVPHLSAAMGKETWILLPYVPDWRWLLDREDSPWYPSVKLYRQSTVNDWNSVLERVRVDLAGN